MESIEELVQRLSEQPAFAAVLIALLGAFLFFIARRVLSVALVFALGFFAVAGYFAYTGEEPPEAFKEFSEKAKEGALKAKEKAKEVTEKVRDDLKEAAKAGVKDALEE